MRMDLYDKFSYMHARARAAPSAAGAALIISVVSENRPESGPKCPF
jgi:hypothetical protein